MAFTELWAVDPLVKEGRQWGKKIAHAPTPTGFEFTGDWLVLGDIADGRCTIKLGVRRLQTAKERRLERLRSGSIARVDLVQQRRFCCGTHRAHLRGRDGLMGRNPMVKSCDHKIYGGTLREYPNGLRCSVCNQQVYDITRPVECPRLTLVRKAYDHEFRWEDQQSEGPLRCSICGSTDFESHRTPWLRLAKKKPDPDAHLGAVEP